MKSKSTRAAKGGPAKLPPTPVMPEFMAQYERVGLEGLGPLDFAWGGVDGTQDPDIVLSKYGHDPHTPLDYILLGLINGYAEGKSTKGKLAQTRRAIGAEKTHDARTQNDYSILLDMGIIYLKRRAKSPKEDFPLQPIARACLEKHWAEGTPRYSEEDSQIKRICAKFKMDQDTILARITMDKTPERIQTLQKICEILKSMKNLGIKVSWDHVVPAKIGS